MVKSQVRKFVFDKLCNESSQLKKASHMRYTKLGQPAYLTELDPDYVPMIFKAKLEMFDIKINFKGLYPSNLLCPFCNVVNEDFSHPYLVVNLGQYKGFVRGLTSERLIFQQRLKCVGKVLMKYERMRSILV